MSDAAPESSAGSFAPAPPYNEPNRNKNTPQQIIDEFWAKFTTKNPGKANQVLPANTYAETVARKNKNVTAKGTQVSYEEAVATCRAKVEKIVKECRRINKRYRDPHFDIETDLKWGVRDCLQGLSNSRDEDSIPGADLQPNSAKRVTEIFDDPQLYIDGPTSDDVKQGRHGDCWFIAALCTLSNKPGLIEKVLVAHDQDVGVYGFVFYKDSEWISEVVDDFLYLIKPDYDESFSDRMLFDDIERANSDEAYRKLYQTNSSSLYFAQCASPNETWLPLLEKAYAKAHGDYSSLSGGLQGEALEELTGGYTSELWTTDILDKEKFWQELMKCNVEFLFGCSTGIGGSGSWGERKGIIESHAYSIQKAVEIDGQRLLRLKNPWGKGEWTGAWSDGSKEWTPYWMERLSHRFGDDGDFWISYKDLLRKYQAFERTRLFDETWSTVQTWTTLDVPWALDYHDTHFKFSLPKPGPVVIVLSQLDDRYFRGLEGQYAFSLTFRVHQAGHEDYLVRSQTPLRMSRSANVELELEAGDYEVRVKVDATRDEDVLPIDEVIRRNAKTRRDKLIRMGLAYDLAHSKGKIIETNEEKAAREAYEKKIKEKSRAKIKRNILKNREESHYLGTKKYQRALKKIQRKKEKHQAKLAERQARKEQAKAEKAAARAAAKEAEEENPEGPEEEEVNAAEVPLTPKSDADEEKAEKVESEEQPTNAAEDAEEQQNEEEEAEEEGEEEEDDDEDSDDDDDDDLSSVGTLSNLSERELEIAVDNLLPPVASEPSVIHDDESDDFEKDPWNAVVVVGLRIYHKSVEDSKDDKTIELKIVRPIHFDDDEDEAKDTCKTQGLDVDDSAKDLTVCS